MIRLVASIWLLGLLPGLVTAQTVEPQRSKAVTDTATAGLTAWRDAFRKAESKAGLNRFHSLMDSVPGTGPVADAFGATADLLKSSRSWNPLARLRGFRRGTAVLDRSVAASPENPDIRFLRWTVQTSAPAFLGYRDEIDSDQRLIEQALHSGVWSDDLEYEAFIRELVETRTPRP